MTIARRLILLLAVPLLVLFSLGIFIRAQLTKVEGRVRYAAETQVQSLATLGNISRTLSEMRTDVRSYFLSKERAEQTNARQSFDRHKDELARFLQHYGDALISDSKDQRLLFDYRTLSDEWTKNAEKVMSLALEGRRDEALGLLQGLG